MKCMASRGAHHSMASRNVASKHLPPISEVFHLHLRQCVYQFMTWGEKAFNHMLRLSDAVEYGYEQDDN